MKTRERIPVRWSPEFAYAIGLIATDGNLSPDGRHIAFTSKDKELADNIIRGLGVATHIGRKASGSQDEKNIMSYNLAMFRSMVF